MKLFSRTLTAAVLAGALVFGATPEPVLPEAQAQAQSGLAIAAIVVGAGITVLTIYGVYWYLCQDGKTFVRDKLRINETPTPEEEAASQQMLEENRELVMAQVNAQTELNQQPVDEAPQPMTEEAPATVVEQPVAEPAPENVPPAIEPETRGIAAETGSNTAARGAAALLTMTLLAPAGVLAGRRKKLS